MNLREADTLKPVVECKRCRKRRRTKLLGEMICRTCYDNEPKANCGVCGKEKRFVTEGAGVCHDCIKRAAQPATIECAKCGKSKAPAKAYGDYCRQCQKRVNCGEGTCSRCGEHKPYLHVKYKLCRRCNRNRRTQKRLQGYLETVIISHEYNLTLFRHLTGLINWESLNEETRLRFKDFGEFLQSYHFDGPLTWEDILKLKEALPGIRYFRVRSCLEQLGELLLDPRKDEDLAECQRRSRPLEPVFPLGASVVAVLKKYDLWLRTERKNALGARRNHFAMLGRFWRWCVMRGLTSLARVEAAHVAEYLHTLGLKWTCRHCSFTKNITTRGEAPPTACENLECRALNSFEKEIRCVEETVRGQRSRLVTFFAWLKDVEEGIEINPAPAADGRRKKGKKGRRRMRKNAPTIQYYAWEVIDALLKAIEDPEMPAEEAMVLYLVLHHAFYQGELQTVRIPSQCRPRALGVEPGESLEDVLRLEWLPRELSRGRQSLGRSGEIFHMEPADEPWLRDLVRRFMRERNQKLRSSKNPYLFVGASPSPRGGPVADRYFRRLIVSATARITGRACTIKILGKCSRLLYSEFGGHEGFRHLRELGLGEYQARTYAWAKPVRVVPRQATRTQKKDAQQPRSSLAVPPIDVLGISTDFEHEVRED